MEKSILAAYTPPLRKGVRKPAGFPTPFGVGLPGLILCSGQVRPQTKCRLGKGPAGPFPLPLSPRATLQALRASSPQGEPLNLFRLHSEGGEIRKISHAEHRSSSKSWFGAQIGEGLCPSPCPYPKGDNPSVTASLCHLPLRTTPPSARWYEVTRRVRAANLKHERFGEKSIVCSFRKISHAQHRNVPKGRFGAKGELSAQRTEGLPSCARRPDRRQSAQPPLARKHLCRPRALFPYFGRETKRTSPCALKRICVSFTRSSTPSAA